MILLFQLVAIQTFPHASMWMTQGQIGDLFEIESNTVAYSLKEIFASDELKE